MRRIFEVSTLIKDSSHPWYSFASIVAHDNRNTIPPIVLSPPASRRMLHICTRAHTYVPGTICTDANQNQGAQGSPRAQNYVIWKQKVELPKCVHYKCRLQPWRAIERNGCSGENIEIGNTSDLNVLCRNTVGTGGKDKIARSVATLFDVIDALFSYGVCQGLVLVIRSLLAHCVGLEPPPSPH